MLSATVSFAASNSRQQAVAEILELPPDLSDEDLERGLEQLISECLCPDDFNVERISLIVARFDALREEATTPKEDLATLTDLQDLLLPLCIHPHVKSEVLGKLQNGRSAIIDEAVALVIGAELVAAPAEGRTARFRLNDQGEIAGKGLLSVVDAAVGNPDPEYQIGEILKDLADQVSVNLDLDCGGKDIRVQIIELTDQLKLALRVRQTRKSHYCVVQPPENTELRTRLIELLERVRQELPELVFFELSRKSKAKAGEEVVMQILKDRFRNEGQSNV
jgi:hypothetical protein